MRHIGRVLVVLVTALAAVGGATVQVAAFAPAASVAVGAEAREGQGGTILGSVRARCAVGYTVQELTIEVTQDGFTSPGQQLPSVPCDGVWHRVAFTSFEGFDPGPATIAARLTVVDVQTGDPAPQAVDVRAVWVRAAAKLALPRVGSVHHGTALFWLGARCDRPWVEPDLSVSVSQAGGTVAADGTVVRGHLRCDGRWHRLLIAADPAAGHFHRGHVDVLAFLTVLDPDSFDPVAQAQASRSLRLR